jgi:hypothetical protein
MRYLMLFEVKTIAACFLPHPENEHQQSVTAF